MNKFEIKTRKLIQELAWRKWAFGSNSAKRLEEKCELYKEVNEMTTDQVVEELVHVAGVIEKANVLSGNDATKERKLIKVLRERIKAENSTKDISVEIGCADKEEVGFEVIL